MLCGLNSVQKDNKVPFNFLDKNDIHFKELHKTLDTVFSDLHSRGIGAKTSTATVISYEDEELLWTQGILGYNSPRALLNTVFYYVGLLFCLRGGQEQRSLSWKNFKRVPDDAKVYTSSTYYDYFEFASKNNQHRFRDIRSKNKCVKAYVNCDSDKFLVRILDFYKTKLPSASKAFYLRPLEKTPADPDKAWFVNMPIGVNTLNTLVSKMFEKCDNGQSVKYTNHSLRATAASRLFEKSVPEKVIAERTGHTSLGGLRAYERTTNQQDQAACTALVSKVSEFNDQKTNDVDTTNAIEVVSTSQFQEKVGIPSFSGTFHGCTFNF